MFDIGFFEILLIGIIALLILGPKRLPGFLTKLEEYVKLIRSKKLNNLARDKTRDIFRRLPKTTKKIKMTEKKLS